MKLSVTLLLASIAVGVVVHGVIDAMRPARILGTSDLPPVVAQGSLSARVSESVQALDMEAQRADDAPAAAPFATLAIERDSERFAALGKHASSTELANAAVAAIGDADEEARVQAIELLGDSRQSQYVPILAAALADRNNEVQFAALQALARHGTDEALSVLRAGLPSFDEDMREFAAAALADPRS